MILAESIINNGKNIIHNLCYSDRNNDINHAGLCMKILPVLLIYITTYMCIKKVLKKDTLDILSDRKTICLKVYKYELFKIFKSLPIFVQIIKEEIKKYYEFN